MIIIIQTVDMMFRVILLALFARAIMSWFVRDYSHPIPNFIYKFTEPFLIPMRMLFERFNLNRSMIDFSFIASFIAIQILNKIVIRILVKIYMMM